MTLSGFIRRRRPVWKALEILLRDADRLGLHRLRREQLRELVEHYRATTADLAFAQTYYQGTTLLLYLHQLTAQAHHEIYRSSGFSWSALLRFFRQDVPAAVQASTSMVLLAAALLIGGYVFGLTAAQAGPEIGTIILPQSVLDSIYARQMWTDSIFSAVPSSVASSDILRNNITVALLCFVGGLSAGLYPAFVLCLNGFLLGVAFKLCSDHGLLSQLSTFVVSHGCVEISCIVLAGAAGLVLGRSILQPGPYTRSAALAKAARTGGAMALACVPVLFAVGIIEGYVSPSPAIPTAMKVLIGLTTLAAFWAWLLVPQKSNAQHITTSFGYPTAEDWP